MMAEFLTEKRTRTLTEKGQQMFNERHEILKDLAEKSWNEVEDVLVTIGTCEKDLKKLREVDSLLNTKFKEFCKHSSEYENYLCSINTEESTQLLLDYKVYMNKCISIVKRASNDLKAVKLELIETMSRVSSNGSLASIKRAKAEAGKAKLQFIKQEGQLMRQKADIEAELNVTRQQKEIAALEAETKVLEGGSDKSCNDLPSEIADKEEMTKKFVMDDHMTDSKANIDHIPLVNPPPVELPNTQPVDISEPVPQYHNTGLTNFYGIPTVNIPQNPSPVYIPTASRYKFTPTNIPPVNPCVAPMIDFSKFMLRKDLLLTRFSKFDDKAETFAAWSASFRSITSELSLTPFEEMDLIVKWLGPESSKFAQTLRSATPHDPRLGLRRIWDRLHDRYGRPEMIEQALKRKLNSFPVLTNKDNVKLYDLVDVLIEVESAMANPELTLLLSYFNSSTGVLPIVTKLPPSLQEKWSTQASNYKKRHCVPFPPFSFFVNYVREMCEMRNDPGLTSLTLVQHGAKSKSKNTSNDVTSRKIEISTSSSARCPIHNAGHSLNECRGFRKRSLQDRQKFLRDKRICFRCCASDNHISKNCTADVKCEICGNSRHATALHVNRSNNSVPFVHPQTPDQTTESHGGETTYMNAEKVGSLCTKLCRDVIGGRSCGKIVLVDVFTTTNPKSATRVYAVIDDQSNRTLISTDLMNQLGVEGGTKTYNLSTCSGNSTFEGRCVDGLCVKSIDGSAEFNLPEVIECDSIPSDLCEIPTPEVAIHHAHLNKISSKLPELDPNVKFGLLIGRDLPDVHHVKDQIIGSKGQPFAQHLPLGWVIIGEVCIGKTHPPKEVNVRKTNILNDGRHTTFPLCPYNINVKEIHNDVFVRTPNDNKVGSSVEDRKFLALMDAEFCKDKTGHWSAPLPFKDCKPPMPNNFLQAKKRAQVLESSFRKDPRKKEHFFAFMSKVLGSGAAEVAPTQIDCECWYLPLFGVYHPKKPNQIRGVFDSSAEFNNISLNSVLMSGPDLTNNLIGILMRFRKDAIAICGDIEQMFYAFHVHEEHRNYLRFLWYEDNDFTKPLIEYRMKSHVFGNSPSPAVATYGLRKASSVGDSCVQEFVNNNFYVDDGLISLPCASEAVNLMKKTQATLRENGHIRLHKIASNSVDVMEAFPMDDLEKNLKNFNVCETLPVQHNLGMIWDLNKDMFVFQIADNEKPLTKRGLLSTMNSLFDPLGFISPVTISGKILQRELVPSGSDWDEPLSNDNINKWRSWLDALQSMNGYHVPRMIVPTSVSTAHHVDVHVFSDASEKAIAAVAYLRVICESGDSSIGFLMGKSKLAPLKGHTIPRLELCGAVLATEVGEAISTYLSISLDRFHYYTDSKVVLGYISNTTRRFFMYVSNRVEKIHRISSPSQWSYVSTDRNPADAATRHSNALDSSVNRWISGPEWLKHVSDETMAETFPLISPECDSEIRQEVVSMKTKLSINSLEPRFVRFDKWETLVKAILVLKLFILNRLKKNGHKTCVDLFKDTEMFVISQVQQETYRNEIENLKCGKPIPRDSKILRLDPFLDTSGILRVGGRLKYSSKMLLGEKNPVLVPGKHHIAKLIVLHFHELVRHQGRHLTDGAIRAAGYWITSCKRLVYSLISSCVKCRRLRGAFVSQKMADLPEERLTSCPPFTYVGVDCFGPWDIVTRRTRGGSANSKRWAVLFACLSCRGVHIEVIEEMSTSSFINALRRFISIRGHVKEFFSDRGTNFVGGTRELGINSIYVEDSSLKAFLQKQETVWRFNTPLSSHMGGAWERLIGVTRRILDSILFEVKHTKLTHEVLCTFMAEATAIINARPLVPVSTDPDSPCILSPSALLTQKVNHSVEDFKNLSLHDVYTSQWKYVQTLAERFWSRWRCEYLQSLQIRRKWKTMQENIRVGDLVLLKDSDCHRNYWPTGLVERVFPGKDGLVRKLEVKIIKDGKPRIYVRPITEIVLLCHSQ